MKDSRVASLSVTSFMIGILLSVFLISFIPQAALAETNDADNEISTMSISNTPSVYNIQEGSASHSFYGNYIADFKFKITKTTKVELVFNFDTSKSRSCTFSLYKGDSEFANLGMVMKSSSSYSNAGYTNIQDGVVSKGNGNWSYTATLEPGDYYVQASVFSSYAKEVGNFAWVQMKTVADSSQKPSSSTSTNTGSSSNNSSSNSASKPGTSSVSKPGTSSGTQASTVSSGKWVHSSKGWWYSYSNGTYATGWKKIGNATYYFNSKGWMKTGWQKISGTWYYFKSSGAMATGWQKVSGKWYYLGTDGKMKTGKQTISGKTYYLKSSGAMATGWQKIDGKWYHFKNSGAMSLAWLKSGGKWYYLDINDGRMLTGFYYSYIYNGDTAKQYYANSSGAMQTGWIKANNKWYYANKSGAIQKNKWISGKYWVGSNGVMATSSWVDGGKYYVDGNGKWVKGKKKPASTSTTTNSNSSSTTTSTNTSTTTAQDPITKETWLMTALSSSGSSGLVSVRNPNYENYVSFGPGGVYSLVLNNKVQVDALDSEWKYLETQDDGDRDYMLYYLGSKLYYGRITNSGSLILMMMDDTDYSMCFERASTL